jgi:N-acetyl-gamma-glutamyl-phosphate/LysW-gamma-L-alpha-aminoadipyl-6-phosphate reductase
MPDESSGNIRTAVVGGSGYVGGELIRLLLDHPRMQLLAATSRQFTGQYLYQVHPNLRKRTTLQFTDPGALEEVDLLFLALPHGESQARIEAWAEIGARVVDLSADFRLQSPSEYERWYSKVHQAPLWLPRFIYGLPELNRDALAGARYVSGVGCNAAATILALTPLVRHGLVDASALIIGEVKAGSSEGGARENPGSHHPERSGVIRTYAPYGHRHTPEVLQALGLDRIALTMTSVDLVRGALATVHVRLKPGVGRREIWGAYRETVAENPFIRLVKEKRGVYRVPEPKILAGSNYADLGFAVDEAHGRVVAMAAIDNLMKGAAGSAVQAANLMLGMEETAGLAFPGLHPI